MVVFPLLSTLISLACAAVIARDAARSPRPYKTVWTIAFAVFALGAGAKTAADLTEWTPLLARAFYLAGAVLVVAYLAIGELYLLAGRRIAAFAPGVMLLLTAITATAVFNARLDESRLQADGWEAIDRASGLGVMTAVLNGVGTIVLVGGVLYSAWRFKRLGTHRHRMIGCILIAVGTLIVATGGTATRLGHEEYYYVMMSVGVAIIFAGYLQTRRPDTARVTAEEPAVAGATSSNGTPIAGSLVSLTAIRGQQRHEPLPSPQALPHSPTADPAIAFIETRFLPLNDAALAAECRVWSAERSTADIFTREEAQRVWALRLRLSAEAQAMFDNHSVGARLQLAELYHEVLAPEASALAQNG